MAKTSDETPNSGPIVNSEPVQSGVTLQSTTIDNGDAANAETPERPAMKDLQGVRYSGASDVRRISVDDLKRLGVDNVQKDLEWSRENDFIVPATDLNAATVDALIELPGFTAV